MESILIVGNGGEVASTLAALLEENYCTYLAIDLHDGEEIIAEYHIDIFILMIDDDIDEKTWTFIKKIHYQHLTTIPFIFISKNPSKTFYETLSEYPWYHLVEPVNHEKLLTIIQRAILQVSGFNDKVITLRKNRQLYQHEVKDIVMVERQRQKYITIYSHHSETQAIKETEYFFAHSLSDFIKTYRLDKFLQQTHQSWLVNKAQIKKLNLETSEIILRYGKKAPVSRKYLKDF